MVSNTSRFFVAVATQGYFANLLSNTLNDRWPLHHCFYEVIANIIPIYFLTCDWISPDQTVSPKTIEQETQQWLGNAAANGALLVPLILFTILPFHLGGRNIRIRGLGLSGYCGVGRVTFPSSSTRFSMKSSRFWFQMPF